MNRITQNCIQAVINRLDAVEIVNSYLHLESKNGRFVGLCPFHNEKTPSFHVNPDLKLYHCFGCGKGGTIVNFVMEMEKLTFLEAIELLAERFGVTLEYEDLGKITKSHTIQELYELYNRVAGSFHYWLVEKSEGKKAFTYILQRGITKELINSFNLGYAPQDRHWLFQFLGTKGYSQEFLASSGLFSKKDPQISFFSRRIMFPITDVQGRVQAFGGRILEEGEPKYLNSADSTFYQKGRNLFGFSYALPHIRHIKSMLIVEGYMDVLALHQAGICHAVGTLGTALTTGHIALIRRFVDHVTLFFDSDNAGHQATYKAILLCRSKGLSVSVVVPSQTQKDPAELLQKEGTDILTKKVKHAILDVDYLVSYAKTLFENAGSEQKVRAVAFMTPYLHALTSEVLRETTIEVIAHAFNTSVMSVIHDSRSEISQKTNIPQKEAVHIDSELILLSAVAINEAWYQKFRSQISLQDIENPDAREIFTALETCLEHGEHGIDAILSHISSKSLKNILIKQIDSGTFTINPEMLISDGINTLKRKRIKRKHKDLISKMNSFCHEEIPQALLDELYYINTEIKQLESKRRLYE
ncbi:MAG: DNA primase [Treponema sp.]|jgi:DNA primase|nr:DNA primase [Treponema sp.]